MKLLKSPRQGTDLLRRLNVEDEVDLIYKVFLHDFTNIVSSPTVTQSYHGESAFCKAALARFIVCIVTAYYW